MPSPLQTRRITIGGPRLAQGTGVASYEEVLRVALSEQGWTVGSIVAPGDDRAGSMARMGRWLAAVYPLSRRLSATDSGRLAAADVYRIAQVHFDIFGRFLELTPPVADGLVHWTYPLPLRVRGWINVYTAHDAIPLLSRELSPVDGARLKRILRVMLATADGICTVSDHARRSLASALAVDADRFDDCGVATLLTAEPRAASPEPYLLICGSIEPRKNIERAVEAYRRSGVACPLIVAGPDGWQGAAIRARIGTVPGVVLLPYQDRAALLGLLRGARALLMPSLGEGFGLPVLEAMAVGTPVVTSDTGALAEVAGDAALRVNPLDVDAFAAAIARIVTDDACARSLSERGMANAARFGVARFSERLYAFYAKAEAHA